MRLGGIIASTGLLALVGCGDDGPSGPPPCGSLENGLRTVIPGPGQAGYDEALAASARAHDRLFVAVYSRATGLNADYSLNQNTPEARAHFETFVQGEGWDFEAVTGAKPEDLGVWHKTAGLYGGVGAAADAYRYGVLRDSGAACADVEQARAQLVRALEGLDVSSRITGVPGVQTRGLINTAFPTGGFREPTPLFDAEGNPLPEEKNNGEWRADNSGGAYADWVWEDSLSRDMLVGWAAAYGAAWEVIHDDDSFAQELKDRLRDNARHAARALMKVGESGHDLEIPDADGRLTFHAYLNEHAVDRIYFSTPENGFHATMALGIIAAYARMADDPEIDAYLSEQLVAQRRLHRIAANEMLINFGVGSNFSGFNMAFTGMWLAQRYLDDEVAQGALRLALETQLWTKDGLNDERQPRDMGQSFFDVIYAAGKSESRAGVPGIEPVPADALARGLVTLKDYPAAPVFDREVENCDAAELAAGECVLDDGTQVRVLGDVGWKGTIVADRIVPMAVRPRSNYYWRSNPYQVNGGSDSGALMPAVDFRIAYWLGRWARVAE